jgi:hypothetical protein
MSRKFGQIESGFWHSKKLHAATDQAKLLAVYLLSCPHRNSSGMFRVPLAYIGADLGWPEKQVRIQVSELVSRRLIEYDEQVSILRFVGWFGHNEVDNRKHAQAVINQIEELKCSSPVYKAHVSAFLAYLNRSAKEYLDGLDTGRLTCEETGEDTGIETGLGTQIPILDTDTSNARHAREIELRDGFAEFWKAYPRKEDRADVERAYRTARKHASHGTVMAMVAAAKAKWDREHRDPKYLPYGGKWLRAQDWPQAEADAIRKANGSTPVDLDRFAENKLRREAERLVSETGLSVHTEEGHRAVAAKIAEMRHVG